MSDKNVRTPKKSKRQSAKSTKKMPKSTRGGKRPKSDPYTAIAKVLDTATSEDLAALQSSLLKGGKRVAGIPLSQFDAGYLAAQLVAYHKKRKRRRRPKIYLELFFVDT
jgi:hypothetical protein